MRPNIRVEIQNNLAEDAMEVDENEEGELSDDETDPPAPDKQIVRLHSDDDVKKAAFGMDVEIVIKNDQEKLQERAKRFRLNPEEIKNFSEDDLQVLYSSLGITPSNETNVRFEVIHMRGIEPMNAADILDYFLEYAPVSMEWIDEESCNVVWFDKISSARALHFLSKPVRGMPVRDDSSYFDNVNESEEIDQSVLIMNRNRQVELQDDSEPVGNKLLNETNSVDISEITATIPPGFWRLGNKITNAKCLLLRFGLKTDKKPLKTEQFSRYYKAEGKKNAKTASGKQSTHGIFGRNKEMKSRNPENPWTVLAKNWDEDSQFREHERDYDVAAPKIVTKNQSLRVRLGTKRKEDKVEEEEKSTIPKKVKIPRMKMYADEEEEKIKRKKLLKKIDHQIKKIEDDTSSNSDLRTLLNMTNRTHGVKIEQHEPESFDLGARLKNRNKKMVFEIKSEGAQRGKRRGFGEEERGSVRESEGAQRGKRRGFGEVERGSVRERISRRKYSSEEDDPDVDDEDDDGFASKPRSKVAVVIKTQKKPAVASAVASTVWSRVSERSNNSESESEEMESKTESEEEEEEIVHSKRTINRPGFRERGLGEADFKSPLKIEINNDHFKRN